MTTKDTMTINVNIEIPLVECVKCKIRYYMVRDQHPERSVELEPRFCPYCGADKDGASLVLRIERENQVLRKALSPFVYIYENKKEAWRDLDDGGGYPVFDNDAGILNVEDFRAAYNALWNKGESK